jgi:hypothetical protein
LNGHFSDSSISFNRTQYPRLPKIFTPSNKNPNLSWEVSII